MKYRYKISYGGVSQSSTSQSSTSKSINTEEINDNYLISEMTNIIKELNKEKEITIDL